MRQKVGPDGHEWEERSQHIGRGPESRETAPAERGGVFTRRRGPRPPSRRTKSRGKKERTAGPLCATTKMMMTHSARSLPCHPATGLCRQIKSSTNADGRARPIKLGLVYSEAFFLVRQRNRNEKDNEHTHGEASGGVSA